LNASAPADGGQQDEKKETRTPAPPSDDLTQTQHTLTTAAGELR
jgi:hypothetical protein